MGWGVIFFSPGRSTGRSVIYGDTWRTLAPAPLPLIPGKLSMHSAVRTCGSRVSLVRNIQYISFCVYTSSAPLEATTVYLLLMTGWLVCTDLRTAIHTYLQAPPSSLPPPSWAPCSRNLVKSSILFLYSLFLFLFFIFFTVFPTSAGVGGLVPPKEKRNQLGRHKLHRKLHVPRNEVNAEDFGLLRASYTGLLLLLLCLSTARGPFPSHTASTQSMAFSTF